MTTTPTPQQLIDALTANGWTIGARGPKGVQLDWPAAADNARHIMIILNEDQPDSDSMVGHALADLARAADAGRYASTVLASLGQQEDCGCRPNPGGLHVKDCPIWINIGPSLAERNYVRRDTVKSSTDEEQTGPSVDPAGDSGPTPRAQNCERLAVDIARDLRERAHHPTAWAPLLTEAAGKLESLLAELAETRRKECSALCRDVEEDRDRLLHDLSEDFHADSRCGIEGPECPGCVLAAAREELAKTRAELDELHAESRRLGDQANHLVQQVDAACMARQRIAEAHHKHIDAHGGTYGECNECGNAWPCPTYVWATTDRDPLATWDPADDDPAQPLAAASPATTAEPADEQQPECVQTATCCSTCLHDLGECCKPGHATAEPKATIRTALGDDWSHLLNDDTEPAAS